MVPPGKCPATGPHSAWTLRTKSVVWMGEPILVLARRTRASGWHLAVCWRLQRLAQLEAAKNAQRAEWPRLTGSLQGAELLPLGCCRDAEEWPKSAQLGLVLANDFLGILQGELGQPDDLGVWPVGGRQYGPGILPTGYFDNDPGFVLAVIAPPVGVCHEMGACAVEDLDCTRTRCLFWLVRNLNQVFVHQKSPFCGWQSILCLEPPASVPAEGATLGR